MWYQAYEMITWILLNIQFKFFEKEKFEIQVREYHTIIFAHYQVYFHIVIQSIIKSPKWKKKNHTF